MKVVRLYIIFLILLGPLSSYGQSTYEIGVLPEVNIDTKLATLNAINVEIAPRFEWAQGTFEGESETDIFYSLLDITSVMTRTVGVDAKVGFGYLVRFREDAVIHRFIQQYSFTTPYFGYRLGHRFRVDQTFAPNENLEVRMRYRLSSDISLNGEFIDPGEVYLKIGQEYVYAIQGSETDLEIRLVPSFGYYFDDANKVELGIDYRLDSFLTSAPDHRFWLNLGYYLSL
ncbi:DUF2490 domain-containing protein [Dokdonia sp. Hel_I_53]|uniref:DUF2490 domain-containing protein n=1 Tax=Dokdonia sp. Hel_I_53 TaxID=1566287 RepID=UPI00119C0CAD|nr:DUF2490 domain-containing protein [Dokdonia sp. Hel_I_53]TVZ52523.1 uncharacterized protein DUF2490 [Dokdonia sp. Hel_I_53]